MSMSVLYGTDSVPAMQRPAITIGVFDGVHAGHRSLLRKLRQTASRDGMPTMVVTFEPHPLWTIRPVAAPKTLTNLEQRLALLEGTGSVDYCVVIPFDKDLSQVPADEFVSKTLVNRLNAGAVLVGHDFRFGHNRLGTIADLQRLGKLYDFSVDEMNLMPAKELSGGVACSSTYIRRLIADGNVELAARLLGRLHEVVGKVVGTTRPMREDKGVPTVTVRVSDRTSIPATGSFAGSLVSEEGRQWSGAVSVREGTLFDRLLDVHLVGDFRLMDQTVRVSFKHHLWAETSRELHSKVSKAYEEESESAANAGWGGMR